MKPAPIQRLRNRWEKIFKCRFQSFVSQIHSAGYVSVQKRGGSPRTTLAILIRSLCRERSEKQVTSARFGGFRLPRGMSDGVDTFANPAPRKNVMLPNGLLWLFDKPGVHSALTRGTHSSPLQAQAE